MTSRVLATNVLWSLINRFLSRGSLILSAIVLARVLDTQSFAIYSFFQLTISMLAAYASMGMGVSASKFFAEVGHEKLGSSAQLLGTLWCLSILLAFAAFAIILLIPSIWLTASLPIPQWLLASGVLSLILCIVPDGAMLGLEKFKQAAAISFFCGLIILTGAWLSAVNENAHIAMVAIVIAAFFQAICEAVIVVLEVGFKRMKAGFWLRLTEVSRVVEFVGPMFLASVLSASGAWLIGVLILREDDGQYAFALYAIGLQWFSLAVLLPVTLARVVLPRMIRNSNVGLLAAEMRTFACRSAAVATLAAVCVAVVGVLFSPWLISFYGANYQVGRWLIASFMVAAIFGSPVNIFRNAILANDGQKAWLVLTIAWFIVLISVAATLAKFGAWSGAASQAVAGVTFTASAFVYARKRGFM